MLCGWRWWGRRGKGEGGGGRAERGSEDYQEAFEVAGVVKGACAEEGEEHGGEGGGCSGSGAASVGAGHSRLLLVVGEHRGGAGDQ